MVLFTTLSISLLKSHFFPETIEILMSGDSVCILSNETRLSILREIGCAIDQRTSNECQIRTLITIHVKTRIFIITIQYDNDV